MEAADLQAVISILDSPRIKVQGRLLRVGGLLDELRAAVTAVHGGVTALGWSGVELVVRIRSVCTALGDVLEAVLGWQEARGGAARHGAPAATLFRSIIPFRRRRSITRELRRSLHQVKLLSSFVNAVNGEGTRNYSRYDSFETERAIRANPSKDALKVPMVGRSELMEKMVRTLLADADADEEDGPLVMPIMGGPGIGKTRLAQALFDDARIREKFHVRRWENVSASSNLFTRRVPNMWFSAEVHQKSMEKFICSSPQGQGGRYLIVLDDVWDENAQYWREWDSLMQAMPSNGAVILTTRTPAIASRTAAILPTTVSYFLQPLEQELSLQFVDQWVKWYGYGCDRSSEIFHIGLKIANKCDGVPLLLQIAGSLLREKSEQALWQQFLQDFDTLFEGSEVFSSEEERSEILESAYNSYWHLPSNLRVVSFVARCSHWTITLMLVN